MEYTESSEDLSGEINKKIEDKQENEPNADNEKKVVKTVVVSSPITGTAADLSRAAWIHELSVRYSASSTSVAFPAVLLSQTPK